MSKSMTLQELLERVEKLDTEATKGPWTTCDNPDCGDEYDGRYTITTTEDEPWFIAATCYGVDVEDGRSIDEQERANSKMLAESRQLLPLMAKIVRAITEQARSANDEAGKVVAVHDEPWEIHVAERVIEENA